MAVERLTVTADERDAARGHRVVDATVEYRIDPTHPANQGITDLDRVATGADGAVRFRGDARLVVPAGRGNGRLLVVAANRGRALGGDERAADEGWTVAWCGWQWDVPPGPGIVALAAPDATENEAPVGSPVRIEIVTDTRIADHKLSDSTGPFHRYPVADIHDGEAALYERDSWDGHRRPIARDRWGFGRVIDGHVVDDDEHVWLEGGFRAGVHYEVVYRSRISPVAGTGLLAFRDLGAHLRSGVATRGEPYEYAFAQGGSQSGRFLRQWLSEGLNLDEDGKRVFDGAFVGVAGGRRNEVNHRGAQPALMYPIGYPTLPPFATDDLLARQRALGAVPRVVSTNTAWEYWLGDAALSHLDHDGTDLADSDHVRTYFFAGIDHYGDHYDIKRGLPVANQPNPLGHAPLTRAAFDNLVRWVCDGVEPPPSSVPRLADGTAVTRADVIRGFPAIPGAVFPDAGGLPWLRQIDLGPDADKGVPQWPAKTGAARPDLVSQIDGDGNEIAGVRSPQHAVPLGTYTGWNPRRPQVGLPVSLYARCGSFWPFARTETEREQTGDPRPSLGARYRDRDDYRARVVEATDALVAARLMQREDADQAVTTALAQYDELTATS